MLRARKRYGQHFLEAAWADRLVAAVAPRPDDRFLEIGPGPGALTLRLARRAAHVTAIEVDEAMVVALGAKAPANVTLLHADVLETDLTALLAEPTRVVGNLPYNISSPILFQLLRVQRETGRLVDATLMLQKEVAARLAAPPGGRDYGVLSIFVQLAADVRLLLALPPGAFRPAPKVHSAVVRLSFRPAPVEVGDPGLFEQMVRSVFTQRRKMLSNALGSFAGRRGLSAAEALARAGLDGRRRPETLQLAELARLAAVFPSG
jgi:16S rRNA (adenine1518-N6/adenine1519-N6)-dimethyltransferase